MTDTLALKGGPPVRSRPFPSWPVLGEPERAALLAVFDSGVWSFGGPREMEFAVFDSLECCPALGGIFWRPLRPMPATPNA